MPHRSSPAPHTLSSVRRVPPPRAHAGRRGDAVRTGGEPTTARSSLRLRLGLSLWGLAWAVFGLTASTLTGRP
ncbi:MULTISPECIES: DUF6343 family protein [unclassified Streptomyces]|uniref:DUF6343 family protein n=1 Tax=unclassified Streptomyces TaxID=2593676 RepID=UPI00380D1496